MIIFPIDKAKAHLEEAIIQHVEKRNFIIAITLAGVAEEILGKMISPNQENALQELITSLKINDSDSKLSEGGLKLSQLTNQEIRDFLNLPKNQVKHSTLEMEIDPEASSNIMLIRALANFFSLELDVNTIIVKGINHFFPHLRYNNEAEGFETIK